MANVDAFNAGFDAGMGGKPKAGPKKPTKPVKQISTSSGQQLTPSAPMAAKPNAYKKGGKVRKTGIALVHKGERVLTAKQAKKHKKSHSKMVAGKR